MAALPYVTTPGNIDKALQNIKAAATPQSVNQDFVKTILKIPGGSGNQMAAFLRKVGFVRPDGSPSDIYTRFRNDASAGRAAVDALKIGYAPLAVRKHHPGAGFSLGTASPQRIVAGAMTRGTREAKTAQYVLFRGPLLGRISTNDLVSTRTR